MLALDTLSMVSDPFGLNVSWIKTKIQKFAAQFDGNLDLPPPETVLGKQVSFIDRFVYLGLAIVNGDDLS